VVMDVDEAFATSVEVHYIFVECEIIAWLLYEIYI
jgi:hypothetical protein